MTRPRAAAGSDAAYERQKARSRDYQSARSASGRDIGSIPDCEDPDRREACRLNLRLYLETYHAASFELEWSDDHLRLIETLQQVILTGSTHAFAMPRGSGKTTIARHAAQWAIAFGHRRFLVLIGANNEFGTQLLEQILFDYQSNPLLAADFPEICFPLRAIEGINNRAKGQTVNGEPTSMVFGKRIWRLPTVHGYPASGAIIKSGSPKSAVRGSNLVLADGTTVRPDLFIIDDPQTRATAESPRAVATLVRIIQGDVLGSAGPGREIAAAMPCTVIAPGDAADILLNRELHPEWRGTRAKLLYAFPERTDLWEQYWEIYSQQLRDDDPSGTPRLATEFYLANQAEMDRGGLPAWLQRHRRDEVSAIQHAMTLYLKDPHAFLAEYQNEPTDTTADVPQMTVDLWRSRVTQRIRGIAPAASSHVTTFIDVHKRVLVWSASAWDQLFTGAGINYGTYPDQAVRLWRVQQARPTLHDMIEANAGDAAALRAGLLVLIDRLATRIWTREDGAELTTSLIMIDCGYQPDVVHAAIRESKHRALCLPYKGTAKGPNDCPISRYNKRPGRTIGKEWFTRVYPQIGKMIVADTYYWKAVLAALASSAPGDPGSFTWFGLEPDGKRADHSQLFSHLSAEYAQEERGEQTVSVYQTKPGMENHYLDTAVGTTIGASYLGLSPASNRVGVSNSTGSGSSSGQIRISDLRRNRGR